MLGTWCELCYLLAIVLLLRDSLQGRVGGSSYCVLHLLSCLSLLIVLVWSLYCFLSVIAESGVFNMYSAVTFWVMLSMCHAPAALYPRKDPVPIIQEVGWAPGSVWTGAENFARHRDSNPGPSSLASRYTDWATPAHLYRKFPLMPCDWKYFSIIR